MRRLYQFLIVTLLTCLSGRANANEVMALIVATRPVVQVKDIRTDQYFTLSYANVGIENQVRKLQANDFISFEGNRILPSQKMNVESVNFVGLKALLGNWTGNDKFCYQFYNFTELNIFLKNKSNCQMTAQQNANVRKMVYIVNPTTAGWIALISDDSGSYAAELNFKSTVRVELSLYDSNSGDIVANTILNK